MEKKKSKKPNTKKTVKKTVVKKPVKKVVKKEIVSEKKKTSKARKKTKGFTLIEILVVLGLIGVIFLVVIPAMNGISNSVKKRQLETKKEVIISAAEVYAKNNSSRFTKALGDSYMIVLPVRTLLYYGYTNADIENAVGSCTEAVGCIIDPTNSESMNDQLITIKRIKNVIQAHWGEEEVPRDYGVNFNLNGAESMAYPTGGSNGCMAAASAESCTITTPTIVRKDFTIIGWGTSASSKTATIEPGAQLTINDTNNGKTYYAVTKKDVTVSFDANGGELASGSSSSGSCTYYNTSSSCSVSANPDATRSGYTYDASTKWNTNAAGTGSTINLSSLASSLTAYIKWDLVTYTLTLSPNSGTYSSTPSGYTKSGSNYERTYNVETTTFSLPAGPGRVGHIYKGWTGPNVSTASTSVSITKGSTGNKTYTAQWDACPAGKYALAGATSCTACSIGAYNASTGSGVCTACGEGLTTSGTGKTSSSDCTDCSNKAHVATWETPSWSPNEVANLCVIKTCETGYTLSNNACTPTSYVVTLNPNGGTYSSTPSGYTKSGSNYTKNYTIETATFSLPGGPKKAGNQFKGWTGTGVSTASTSVSIAKGSTGNRTYTAQWDACPAGTYATASDSTCQSCPASHPYSAAGATSINQCYRYSTSVASNYSYTSCNYSSESAAMAACGSDKADCLAVPCTNASYYYIANYTIQAKRRNYAPFKYDEYINCTTVMRRTIDIALTTDGNDSSCNYYTALSESGIPTTNTTDYCKSNNGAGVKTPGSSTYNQMHNLQGKCAITSTNGSLGTSQSALCNKSVNTSSNSSDVCNTMVKNMLTDSGRENPSGDCHTYCTLGCNLYSTNDDLNLSNVLVRAGAGGLGGPTFFFLGTNNDGGTIYSSCSGTESDCGTKNRVTRYTYNEQRVRLQNCKVTKTAYSTGSSTYKLQYKAVTAGTTPVYYPN